MKAKKVNQGYYLLEADLERNIYLKEETILSDFGHFHNGVEFILMIEGQIHARAYTELMTVSAGEIFIANSFEYHCYEKLTPDIYTYKKEEIRRLEKRRERGRDNRDRDNANIFAGMDAATKKEMEELMKDE